MDLNITKKEEVRKSFPVKSFLTSIQKLLKTQAPEVWVHGVITQIQEKGYVVYITIADYESGSVKPTATLNLVCWREKFHSISEKTAYAPKPFKLVKDLKVCFLLKAELYVPMGKLQAQILDIDPVYTIGELAITKQEILNRLQKEDLVEKNKRLSLAEIPLHVALITSINSAAQNDFLNQLEHSNFKFQVKTFGALMQGENTEASILQALKSIPQDAFDVVCIVRGGGGKTDLNYFDSEALCRAVAHFPLPVFTGIGHEIDKSLLDIVAYQSCITPTDTAKKIVERVSESWNKVLLIASEIVAKTKENILTQRAELNMLQKRIEHNTTLYIMRENQKHQIAKEHLKRSIEFLLKKETERFSRNIEGLHQGSRKILELEKTQFALIEMRVKATDPQTIMSKGYSLTLDTQGKIIKSQKQLKTGDKLTTKFVDGTIQSIVQ